jgi:hypothetical protein
VLGDDTSEVGQPEQAWAVIEADCLQMLMERTGVWRGNEHMQYIAMAMSSPKVAPLDTCLHAHLLVLAGWKARSLPARRRRKAGQTPKILALPPLTASVFGRYFTNCVAGVSSATRLVCDHCMPLAPFHWR